MRRPRLDAAIDRFVDPVSDRTVRVGTGATITLVGTVLVAVLVSRSLQGYEGAFPLVLGGVFPLGLAVSVTVGGVLLTGSDFDRWGAAHVGVWWVIGSVVAAGTGATILLFESVNDVSLAEPAVIVAGNAATGGLGGMVVGLVAAKRLAVVRQRERERERLADEREKLALLNRIVRHDIGNDLQVISGTAEYLEDHVDQQGERPLKRLQQTTAEAVDLTEQVRTFVDALDGDGVEPKPVSLRRILRTQLGNARERHPEAMIVVDGEVPDVEVLADELLSTVINNLLVNAIEHNDRENPEVELSVEVDAETIRLHVADNGPGIPEYLSDRLFERGERDSAADGTGIGLYIVETLVERYGGDVRVVETAERRSDERGTEFVVELARPQRNDGHVTNGTVTAARSVPGE